jgi:hypothetical protein
MRTVIIALGDQTFDLGVTFGAATDIAKRVADPLMMAREAQVEAGMAAAGLNYQPKWVPTVDNVPVILHIGMKAAGGDMTLAQVQELCADAGFMEARDQAMNYVAAIVTPKAQEKVEGEAKGDPGN